MAKIIYNNIIPFDSFIAINLFGIIFVRKKYVSILNNTRMKRLINHESIHSAQCKELGYIFFYIIYLLEWLIRVLFTKDIFSRKAYRHISFEKEAYDNESNYNYLTTRKHFAQWKRNK